MLRSRKGIFTSNINFLATSTSKLNFWKFILRKTLCNDVNHNMVCFNENMDKLNGYQRHIN